MISPNHAHSTGRLCVVLIVLAAVAALSGVIAFAQTTAPTFQTYRDDEHGFEMKYLSNWKPGEGKQPWVVVLFSPAEATDTRLTRAAVGMPELKGHKAGEPVDLEAVQRAMVDDMKSAVPDAKVVASTDATLGGQPARRVILTGHGGELNIPVKLLVLAAAHNEKGYVVGIIAPEDEWRRSRDGFDKIVETFKFTK